MTAFSLSSQLVKLTVRITNVKATPLVEREVADQCRHTLSGKPVRVSIAFKALHLPNSCCLTAVSWISRQNTPTHCLFCPLRKHTPFDRGESGDCVVSQHVCLSTSLSAKFVVFICVPCLSKHGSFLPSFGANQSLQKANLLSSRDYDKRRGYEWNVVSG